MQTEKQKDFAQIFSRGCSTFSSVLEATAHDCVSENMLRGDEYKAGEKSRDAAIFILFVKESNVMPATLCLF